MDKTLSEARPFFFKNVQVSDLNIIIRNLTLID